MIMIFKVINWKFKLQEGLRKEMVYSLKMNVCIVINLDIGKRVAHDIKEDLERIDMIEEDIDLLVLFQIILIKSNIFNNINRCSFN